MKTAISVPGAGAADQPRGAPAHRGSPSKLSAITRGKIELPPAVVLYGPEGCGKSTWTAEAPRPISICRFAETARIEIDRYPEPENWPQVLAAIADLTASPHDYQTVAFDTLDWVESLNWTYVCGRNGWTDIESPGYGKGKIAAASEWRRFIADAERLRARRNVGLIFVGHANVLKHKNPEGADYGRYGMKLDPIAAGLLREWCDCVLLMRPETSTMQKEGTSGKGAPVRGVSTGRTFIHTTWTGAYDAKNRYSLPDPMEASYDVFAAAVAAFLAKPDAGRLKVEIADLCRALEGAPIDLFNRDLFAATLAAAGDDGGRLKRIADRLGEKVAMWRAAQTDQADRATSTTTTTTNEGA